MLTVFSRCIPSRHRKNSSTSGSVSKTNHKTTRRRLISTFPRWLLIRFPRESSYHWITLGEWCLGSNSGGRPIKGFYCYFLFYFNFFHDIMKQEDGRIQETMVTSQLSTEMLFRRVFWESITRISPLIFSSVSLLR